MKKIKIWHNPNCSKSREAMKIMEENKCESEVIEYLKDTPNALEIKSALEMLGLSAKELMRTKENVFNELNLESQTDETKLIDAMVKIEKVFGTSYKDLDRYVEVMSVGSEEKDNNIVITYGKKVMQIQNKIKAYPQSPFVEFTLYQSYIDKEDYNKAYDVLKSLDNIKLNKQDRARQKYLLGSVLSRLWRDDEANKAYEESIKSDPDSPWAKLSQSAKQI